MIKGSAGIVLSQPLHSLIYWLHIVMAMLLLASMVTILHFM